MPAYEWRFLERHWRWLTPDIELHSYFTLSGRYIAALIEPLAAPPPPPARNGLQLLFKRKVMDSRSKYEGTPGSRLWQVLVALKHRNERGNGDRRNRAGSSNLIGIE